MQTYTCIDGTVLPLAELSPDEMAYLKAAVTRFAAGASADELYALAIAPENPLLARTDRWVTPEVRRHPLYRALFDLEDRAGVREGAPLEPGDLPDTRPLGEQTPAPGELPLPQQR